MTIDRIMALLAFAAFAAFAGIVGFSVKRVDLIIVLAIVVALVVYDLWLQLAAAIAARPRRRFCS